MKRRLIEEINPVLLLIASIILITLLLGLGILHLIIKTIYQTFQVKFWKGPISFINQSLNILYQIWNCIKYLCFQIAVTIDLLGNVTSGEAIEDIVTTEENTLYGKGDITISEATGQLELDSKLNKTGVNFSKVLSKLLDKNHCVNAYLKGLYIKNYISK